MPFLTNDPLPQCLQTSSDIALSPPIGNKRGCGRYLLEVKCLVDGRLLSACLNRLLRSSFCTKERFLSFPTHVEQDLARESPASIHGRNGFLGGQEWRE